MSLEPGSRIGPYEVLSPLGAGGMGEVYRANDSRLRRAVAIKVLPDEVARDPERLARFEREAHVLASLNHPNIASIYGIEESDGVRCLVLELIEGQTLGLRMDAGAMAADEAVRIAAQMAEGLEAAHEKGIVHRDLKPANVMITPEGVVKVLDFGLAKALEGDPSSASANLSLSPTMTMAATRAGVILGTAAYMSPEQAKGKPVDRRSDIWAFGVIFFEMLSGTKMFGGETVSDMLAGVLRADVEWDKVPTGTPPAVRRLLRRCLERDPRLRLRDIGEARIVLADVMNGRAEAEPAAVPVVARAGYSPLLVTLLAVGLAAVAAIAAWSLKNVPEPPMRKFHVIASELAGGPSFTISPDGQSIVYVGKNHLWVRRLDKLEAREVPGTEGATAPFWSPDSQWIGYLSENKVRKVAVAGGESSILSSLPDSVSRGLGASWGADGGIVFSTGSSPLYEIPSRGGDAREILAPDEKLGDDHFHEPSWLPQGRGILFTVHRRDTGTDTLALVAGGVRKVLLRLQGQEIWHPAYSATGHILFRRQPENEGIWALPFSLSKLEATGEPFLVLPGGNTPSVSDDGTLICTLGSSSGMMQLVQVDRKGDGQAAIGQPQPDIVFVSVSPEGGRVAVQSHESENWDIWVHDVARATKTRMTFEPDREYQPNWSPDGQRIVYVRNSTIMIRAADGTGQPETLTQGENPAFSPDGKQLVYEKRDPGTGSDIWTHPLVNGGAPAAFLSTKALEFQPRISPDGRHVVYVSNESGSPEVYLTRFPSGGGKWQVSVNHGLYPIWSRSGDEIYYRNEDTLMAVTVKTDPSPMLGTPQILFQAGEKGLIVRQRAFDITPDGRHFITVKQLEKETGRDQIVVVTNWFSEFEKPQ